MRNYTFHKKTRKFRYYCYQVAHEKWVPSFLKRRYKKQCYALLKNSEVCQRVFQRVNYLNRINTAFKLATRPSIQQEIGAAHRIDLSNLLAIDSPSTYRYDTAFYLSHFPKGMTAYLLPGDIINVPSVHALLKSRPIVADKDPQHAAIMKLDAVRHFQFFQDKQPFSSKKSCVVWRGAAPEYQPHRRQFLKQYFQHPLIDCAQVNHPNDDFHGNYLSIPEQLNYRYVLSIEGNDVATNLKWIMHSNSLCFMVKPKYETWFMEGQLLPGKHYVELKPDFSDIEEKVKFYDQHQDQALKIIQHANLFCQQFKNTQEEHLVGFLVLEKYLHFSGQLHSAYADYFV